MKKEKPNKQDSFYSELPQTDIDHEEIQEEYEANRYDRIPGLSFEQVSQIAKDSLAEAEYTRYPRSNPKQTNTILTESQ